MRSCPSVLQRKTFLTKSSVRTTLLRVSTFCVLMVATVTTFNWSQNKTTHLRILKCLFLISWDNSTFMYVTKVVIIYCVFIIFNFNVLPFLSVRALTVKQNNLKTKISFKKQKNNTETIYSNWKCLPYLSDYLICFNKSSIFQGISFVFVIVLLKVASWP